MPDLHSFQANCLQVYLFNNVFLCNRKYLCIKVARNRRASFHMLYHFSILHAVSSPPVWASQAIGSGRLPRNIHTTLASKRELSWCLTFLLLSNLRCHSSMCVLSLENPADVLGPRAVIFPCKIKWMTVFMDKLAQENKTKIWKGMATVKHSAPTRPGDFHCYLHLEIVCSTSAQVILWHFSKESDLCRMNHLLHRARCSQMEKDMKSLLPKLYSHTS